MLWCNTSCIDTENLSHLVTHGPQLLTLGKVTLYINYTLGDFQVVTLLYSDLITVTIITINGEHNY